MSILSILLSCSVTQRCAGPVWGSVYLGAWFNGRRHCKSVLPQTRSQHGFTEGKSCQTSLITFYDKITSSPETGRAVGVVYLAFRKAFNSVSHSLQLGKLARYRLDGSSVRWAGNWLTGDSQRLFQHLPK